MASIGTDPNGNRRILFVAPDGKRRTVRLGKVPKRTAEAVCGRIEELLAASIHGQPLSRDAALWLADIGGTLHDRLARVGLVQPRTTRATANVTLADFIDGYIASRTDAKPGRSTT